MTDYRLHDWLKVENIQRKHSIPSQDCCRRNSRPHIDEYESNQSNFIVYQMLVIYNKLFLSKSYEIENSFIFILYILFYLFLHILQNIYITSFVLKHYFKG